VQYSYMENLTTESYANWYKSLDAQTQSYVQFTCIPAKIIGVSKSNSKLFTTHLKTHYKSVEKIELTLSEAEKKCANQRKL